MLQWCWTLCLDYRHHSWFKCLLQFLSHSDHLLKKKAIFAFTIQLQLYKVKWQPLWNTFSYHMRQFQNIPINQIEIGVGSDHNMATFLRWCLYESRVYPILWQTFHILEKLNQNHEMGAFVGMLRFQALVVAPSNGISSIPWLVISSPPLISHIEHCHFNKWEV